MNCSPHARCPSTWAHELWSYAIRSLTLKRVQHIIELCECTCVCGKIMLTSFNLLSVHHSFPIYMDHITWSPVEFYQKANGRCTTPSHTASSSLNKWPNGRLCVGTFGHLRQIKRDKKMERIDDDDGHSCLFSFGSRRNGMRCIHLVELLITIETCINIAILWMEKMTKETHIWSN